MSPVQFTTLPECRGEHMVIAEHRHDTREVIYRTRHPERVQEVLKAIGTAWDRGLKEARLDWPGTPSPRGLFGLGRKQASSLDPTAPAEFAVIERHRRLETWDAPIYNTPSIADAHMVLGTVRRVASMAALWSMGLNTWRAPRWLTF